jgi:hypothetical protein
MRDSLFLDTPAHFCHIQAYKKQLLIIIQLSLQVGRSAADGGGVRFMAQKKALT